MQQPSSSRPLGHRSAPGGPLDRASRARLAAEIRADAWELAAETMERAVREHAIVPLVAVGPLGRLAGLPALVAEIARALADDRSPGEPTSQALAARVHEHAREREALGFAPADVVRELLLVRRTLARFVAHRPARGPRDAASTAPLDEAVDDVVSLCITAYLDGLTADLTERARLDPLTGLLNHRAFAEDLRREVARARRYGPGLVLVYVDVDDFKSVNDTLGHPEGDRVLRSVARLLAETMRRSDLAGRLGGDEFAAVLVEADDATAATFLARLVTRTDELVAVGELPAGFGLSAGVAQLPRDAADADSPLRAADERLYEVKARAPRRARGRGQAAAAS